MIDLMKVPTGARLQLKGGGVAEVVENIGDGIWLQMRLENGEEELVHCEEIVGLAQEA